MNLNSLKAFFGSNRKSSENDKPKETFQSAIKKFVDFKKSDGASVKVCGNIVWSVKDGYLSCSVFKKIGDSVTFETLLEKDYPPYRSCPQRLIDEAGLKNSNPLWRDSVYNYRKAMNRKLVKGQKYSVLGDCNYDHVVVNAVTNTNVVGKYGPHDVKISKLKIGEPFVNEVDVDSLPTSL